MPGLLIDTGIDGLYGRGGDFEAVITGFERLIDAHAPDDATPEVIRFPPGMNRAHFEGSGYMKSFPQLAGTVHSFCGCELDHMNLLQCMAEGEDWSKEQKATDVVLTPAACYPLYPVIARRGPLPAGGGLFDLQSYCFRHEPSKDPGPHAALPHARVRPHGDPRRRDGLSLRLDGARQEADLGGRS